MTLRAYSALVMCIGAFVACNPPSDPVLIGDLCVGEEACETRAILERGVAQGRNAIDYEVINTSGVSQEIIVRAGPAALFEEVLGSTENPNALTEEEELELESSTFYITRSQPLAAGERFLDRLTSDELGRESRLWFGVSCGQGSSTCALTTSYVLIIDPLECTSREDCLSGWECDAERGRCLECISGENMCEQGQTCELGRCTPPSQSTCQSTPAQTPLHALWWAVLGAFLFARRTRIGKSS